MAFQATVLKVMIASPSDCKEEREAVRESLISWNDHHADAMNVMLLPQMWEMNMMPTYGSPQAAIDRDMLAKSDIVIGIFRHTLGKSMPGGQSGTEHEIEAAAEQGKHVHLYFSNMPVPQDPEKLRSFKRVQKFRTDLRDKALYGEYETVEQLAQRSQEDMLKRVRTMVESSEVVLPKTEEEIRAIAQDVADKTPARWGP